MLDLLSNKIQFIESLNLIKFTQLMSGDQLEKNIHKRIFK